MKKFWSVIISVMLVLAMAGCGSGEVKEKEPEKPKDAKTLMEEATEKMQDVSSMDFSMQMDMNMEMAGESVDMQMEVGAQIQDQGKETMKIAMPMTIKMPAQGMTMEMKVYYTDGYYYMDVLGTKAKMPMDIAEMMESMEESTGAANISTEGMIDLEMEEKEGLYVISFVGDTEKMLDYTKSVMQSMQSMSGLEGTGVTLDEIKGTITIDKEGFIKEQVVDMNMTMTVEGQSVATTITTTITYNSIGEDVKVVFPNFSEYQEVSITE